MSKKDERVEIRMSKELEVLDVLAEKRNMSRTTCIKTLIRDASEPGSCNIYNAYMMKHFSNISNQMFILHSESKVLANEDRYKKIYESINLVSKEVKDAWHSLSK